MARGAKTAICVGVVAAVAVGGSFDAGGNEPSPAGASAPVVYSVSKPAMELARQPEKATGSKKPTKPTITDLITTDPVAVEANSSRVVVLSCGKSQGIALDGGAITPAAPAQVFVSVLSRANPNPPFANSPKLYYVGVRNLDPIPQAFRATLVCAKGVDIK